MTDLVEQGGDGFWAYEPGVYEGIPDADYHSAPGISKHGLDLINRSPYHFLFDKQVRDAKMDQLDEEEVDAAIEIASEDEEKSWGPEGRALHIGLLEPHRWGEVLPEPVVNRRTKAGKEELAEFHQEHEGAIILRPEAYRRVSGMRESALRQPFFRTLIESGGVFEESALWKDPSTGMLCRCRADFRCTGHEILIDLKSAADASYDAFMRSCTNYRYHVQDQWYSWGYEVLGLKPREFVFAVVEKKPPFGLCLYDMPAEAERVARAMMQRDFETYVECTKTGKWPHYPVEIRTLEFSTWGLRGKVY